MKTRAAAHASYSYFFFCCVFVLRHYALETVSTVYNTSRVANKVRMIVTVYCRAVWALGWLKFCPRCLIRKRVRVDLVNPAWYVDRSNALIGQKCEGIGPRVAFHPGIWFRFATVILRRTDWTSRSTIFVEIGTSYIKLSLSLNVRVSLAGIRFSFFFVESLYILLLFYAPKREGTWREVLDEAWFTFMGGDTMNQKLDAVATAHENNSLYSVPWQAQTWSLRFSKVAHWSLTQRCPHAQLCDVTV